LVVFDMDADVVAVVEVVEVRWVCEITGSSRRLVWQEYVIG